MCSAHARAETPSPDGLERVEGPDKASMVVVYRPAYRRLRCQRPSLSDRTKDGVGGTYMVCPAGLLGRWVEVGDKNKQGFGRSSLIARLFLTLFLLLRKRIERFAKKIKSPYLRRMTSKAARTNDFNRRVRDGAPTLRPDCRKASDYQLQYVQGLLRKAGRREYTEQQLQELTVFQASRLIECLLDAKK